MTIPNDVQRRLDDLSRLRDTYDTELNMRRLTHRRHAHDTRDISDQDLTKAAQFCRTKIDELLRPYEGN